MKEHWETKETEIKCSFAGQAVPDKQAEFKGKISIFISDIIINVFLLEWKDNGV